MRVALCVLVALSTAACGPKTPAAGPESQADPLDQSIPMDPGVRHGTLDNGMRYFIEQNNEPENRAVFRLVVDAGSVLEDEDQLGLAHFLEHMAFNGTENFEGNELINYLESVGTRFGAHLNAHTSFDETVYKLQVPTDDAEVFDKAFVIMDDWARGMRLDPEEIEKERGVVLEEWRRRLGAGHRSMMATAPVVYPGSPYPDRMPIGTEESLKTFTHEALERFYTDWYRPDLMSLIVVGNVDLDAVEARIQEQFSDFEGPETPRERVRPEIEDDPEPTVVVFADPEMTGTSLAVRSPHDWVLENTRRAYRDSFGQQMAMGALNERFSEISRSPDSPFRAASIGRSRMSPTEGAWVLWVRPYEGKTVDAFTRAQMELARMKAHGITNAELQRGKVNTMRSMERYYEERETTSSVTHAEELIRHVMQGETVPGIEAEWEMAQQYIPSVTREEVNTWVATLFEDDDLAITLTMPEKEGLEVPSAEALTGVLDAVAIMELPVPQEEDVDAPLVAEPPEPGSIVAERTDEDFGFTIWTLSNGAEVWFKQTDFKAEEVMFRGRSVGGYGNVSDEDYRSAQMANQIRISSGLGDFDAMALRKRMAGITASLSTWMGTTEEGVRGSAHPRDMEMMFQQLWLAATAPRFDEDPFMRMKKSQLESIANRDMSPSTAFTDRWTAVWWNDFPRYRPWTAEDVESLDLETMKRVYTDRFADFSDYRFTIVGSIDADSLKPMVEQWLAALPTVERETPDARVDMGERPTTGTHDETVRSGSEPKARVRIVQHGPFESNFENRNQLQAFGAVLSVRMREVLREDKGGVYGVSAGAASTPWPEARYTVSVDFVCDPERVPELEQAVADVFEEMKSAPMDAHYVNDHVAKSLRSREEAMRRNSWWLGLADGTQSQLELTNEPLSGMLGYEDRLSRLSPEVIHEVAKQVLVGDNLVHMRHLPEETEE